MSAALYNVPKVAIKNVSLAKIQGVFFRFHERRLTMLNQEGHILIKNYLKDGMSQMAIAKQAGYKPAYDPPLCRNGKEKQVCGPRQPRASKLDRVKPYLYNRL
jgi:hypothetical protein